MRVLAKLEEDLFIYLMRFLDFVRKLFGKRGLGDFGEYTLPRDEMEKLYRINHRDFKSGRTKLRTKEEVLELFAQYDAQRGKLPPK